MELEKLRAEDALKIKTQTQCIQYLEGRFMDLVKNHEKMIQFTCSCERRTHAAMGGEQVPAAGQGSTLQPGCEGEGSCSAPAGGPGQEALTAFVLLSGEIHLGESQSPGAREGAAGSY